MLAYLYAHRVHPDPYGHQGWERSLKHTLAKRLEMRVFARLGEEGFGPVVAALARATTRDQIVEAGRALEALAVDPALYAQALSHPSPAVRERAVCAFQDIGSAAVPYVPQIVALILDPDEEVRYQARHVFRTGFQPIVDEVVPVLRELRRAPGRLRRAALTALFDTAGWREVEPADQELVRRLIAVKQHGEKPVPIEVSSGFWYALRTGDQPAVLDAFDLSDPMPVTMRLGAAATPIAGPAQGDMPSTYVTPEFDGWTLVFADYPGPWPPTERVAELSRRFGTAHLYLKGHLRVGSWCIARDGAIVRFFDDEPAYQSVGAPLRAEVELAAEVARRLDSDDLQWYEIDPATPERLASVPSTRRRSGPVDPAAECHVPGVADADIDELLRPPYVKVNDLAGALSIDPARLDKATHVRGHGVLALTELGRRDGPPRGALPI